MLRKIIKIDSDKCNGCELCVKACHEGAIGIENGKAVLLREDYCDGLGDCLPACEAGAITFEYREALAYDESKVSNSCPGASDKSLHPSGSSHSDCNVITRLNQWPVQLKLVPANGAFFENSHLLIAADCSAFAYGNFHNDFMKDKITIIGCPKLDNIDYSEKITEILQNNSIQSVTVVRMEVPCCGGIERATLTALERCGKSIPHSIVTLSINGEIMC